MKQLSECLNGEYGSYILPFFWQHGDSQELLLEEIAAIEKSGAKEFCVESRIHENFCEDKWWDDFGFILEEAKRRNMRVWLLDDRRFPTGFANGLVEKHPELKKKHLRVDFIDVVGPKPDAAVIAPVLDGVNEHLLNIVAYKRTDEGEIITGEPIGLTDKLENGLVFWDIPDGVYRIFYTIETRLGKARYHLMDMLNSESCKLMLEAVYEPHYEHFKEYFGNTFLGFFSDEPCFGNGEGCYNILGTEFMLVPYGKEAFEMIASQMNVDIEYVMNLTPLLWHTHTDKIHEFRYNYMDVVSKLFKRNFSDMLGNWCREHGVMYIGHIIEDDNCHMRLGPGPAHFFRGLSGQDMSGCDIVLNQMIPGMNEHIHGAPISSWRGNPEFFRYTLSKLCVSDAHLDPKKKGRALCEIFGAFGWAEGVPMMKNLADHMLVSGINYFVPHAFSNRYPLADCPPHFYCNGKNPQFEYFCKLTKYMQRVCHILYGGEHVTKVAVLYNCEAEWCAGEYDLFQKVSKILLQNQIDFDFVPSDYLDGVSFEDGGFVINGENFKTIVVSHASVLPKSLVEKLNNLSRRGVEVIFCEKLPEKYADSDEKIKCENYTVVKNNSLACALEKYRDIKLVNEFKYLRYFHTKNDGKDVYMFSNEDINNEADLEIVLSHGGEYIRYNAWDNSVLYGKTSENVLNLKLKASDSCVIIFEEHAKQVNDVNIAYVETEINPTWNISLKQDDEFVHYDTTEKLYNLAVKNPRFCDVVRYETKISVSERPKLLCFEYIGEIATVYVNGKRCNDVLCAPYCFDVSDKWRDGENEVLVDVIVNLGYKHRDSFSKFLSLPAMGITGKVSLKF